MRTLVGMFLLLLGAAMSLAPATDTQAILSAVWFSCGLILLFMPSKAN